MKPAQARRSIMAVLAAFAATLSVMASSETVTTGGTRTIAIPSGVSVDIYVPPLHADNQRVPLVVLLHGSRGEGLEALRNSGLMASADQHGFIIAMPNGGIKLDKGFAWNIPGVPTTAGTIPGEADRDDVAYITAVMDEMIRTGLADPSRVYVTGISGGGRMASWLGCVASPRIAAIAPVVGLRAGNPSRNDPKRPDPATCRPTRPMPVIAFAGDSDLVNPLAGGGSSYWQYSMDAAESRWAALNGCSSTATVVHVSNQIDESSYTGCREGADVVARITKGGRHRWLADNEVMWNFLASHVRTGIGSGAGGTGGGPR